MTGCIMGYRYFDIINNAQHQIIIFSLVGYSGTPREKIVRQKHDIQTPSSTLLGIGSCLYSTVQAGRSTLLLPTLLNRVMVLCIPGKNPLPVFASCGNFAEQKIYCFFYPKFMTATGNITGISNYDFSYTLPGTAIRIHAVSQAFRFMTPFTF